jgi:hypothetical protein
MNRFVQALHFPLASVLLLAIALPVFAEQTKSKSKPYRAPVRGVMKNAVPEPHMNDTFSQHDATELLAVNPDLDLKWAKDVIFRRDVYNLKFEYKPLRMVWVDLPQKTGKLQRKPIYYVVYSVTNVPLADQKSKPPRYGWMLPKLDENEKHKLVIQYKDRPIKFVPEFLLESPEYHKAYTDRYIPLAMQAIRAREDRRPPVWSKKDKTIKRKPLRSSVEMATEIKVGETLWGVATWEEVDPRIDRFYIYVQGLTNAYRFKDDPKKFKPGAPRSAYRKTLLKTLKLNFWRPGDEFYPEESEIRRGGKKTPDYEWLFLPNLSPAR